jgi:hypothetical protein
MRMADPRQAVAARNAALRRVRRATGAATGAAAALAGIFTALAAGSTHHRHAPVVSAPSSRFSAPAAVVAPAAPLVAVHASAPPPPPTPSPAPVPAPSVTPVVVSGGS